MKVFDLQFTDGKSCRCIVLEESAGDAEEERQLRNNFHPGYVSMVARVMPPPTKIPWKRQSKTMWTCGLFALSKLDCGEFHCFWPGGEVTGDKDLVSKAVRENWNLGVLT